jgi:hypothetical protein
MKSDEDRCREYGVPYDPQITRQEVYDKSRWKCHICGKRVSKRKKYPDPKSPSLDHVIPLSWRKKSPGHVWGNVALAHLVCNQRKGARFAGSKNRVPRKYSLSTINIFRLTIFSLTALSFYWQCPPEILITGSGLCILSVTRRPRRRRA